MKTQFLRSLAGLAGSTAIALAGVTAPAFAQWTGGDDLPTNPLSCDASTPAPAPVAYNGGQPADATAKAGMNLRVVDVPKLVGIGYFNATSAGVAEAAGDMDDMSATTDGPAQANIDDQITLIDNYITSGVDGILFAANDPVAIAPLLRKALGAGIHVVGYDSDAEPDAREWFINPAEFNGVAKTLMDELAQQVGEDGSFAIVTSTFTTPNQARWIAEMEAYQSKCHPDMEWLESVEAQEDNILSFNQAMTLINKYGDDLDGIVGMTSVATPAAAEAVTQAELCGEVAVMGLATPNAIRPYIKSGCMEDAVLWSPVDMGYAALHVLRAAVGGTLKPGDTTVEAGRLGTLQIVNGSEVLLGDPVVFNAGNVENYDF
ncbi:substrate-binding domain-containing protein [Poseidonocella sp. HB161398]|uniref:substrate-binding domain-containing protein n=1 Tax=Poseidonocella sp. HB161398 TaxID=2320855 RepID=UPI001F10717B|nr:substrate-binding domain-containing protein [Poseidonocella sp. HB161398]